MDSAEWELSKENIQPLRSGRKASTLAKSGILIPGRDKDLQEDKNKFESALRTYQGNDPLEPWVNYIAWVEQTYPKGGKEGNLPTLLEKCIKEFRNNEIYSQDVRYMNVWIKYASMAQQPLDLYSFMFNNNLCTKLPDFYINWSWSLEESGNYKKAEQVFKYGTELVDCNDPKFEVMETKHRQFQARVMKRMVNNGEITNIYPISAVEEERSVLGSLKGHGKHQIVGSVRIGPAKVSDQPGVLLVNAQNSSQQIERGFNIFHDENQQASLTKHSTSKENHFPFTKEQNCENEFKAGKWTKPHVGKKKYAVPLDKIDSSLQFSVHQDEGLEQPSDPTLHKLQPGESNVLCDMKTTNDDEQKDVDIALFEPFDPTKIPMYCKNLVYQGTTEFSFEEIKAAKWRKRRGEQLRKQREEQDLKDKHEQVHT